MNILDIKQDLANLKPRKLSGKIRELMSDIEERLEAGVAMDDIVGVLNKSGIAINKATLTVYLSRFRNPKPNKLPKTGARKEVTPSSPQKIQRPPEPKKERSYSHLPLETQILYESLRAKQKATNSPDMIPELMEFYEEMSKL